MNVPWTVAIVLGAGALGWLALWLLRRPRWDAEHDREATRRMKRALPLAVGEYVADVDVHDGLDEERLAPLRAFLESADDPGFTHPENARRFSELRAAVERYLDFVDDRTDTDGTRRRFPLAWETERPEAWEALVTRFFDVTDDVAVCHEEFFRAARRLLGIRRPKESEELFD